MIQSVDLGIENTNFTSKPKKEKKGKGGTFIMKNNMGYRLGSGFQKTSSALIDYAPRGLKGDINSNFYEFLTMGTIPYLAGSAMFIGVFNCVRKFLLSKGHQISANIGNKMALGVVLYGVFKTLSKHLVTTPVKMATGVDTEMPYQNEVCNLPKSANDDTGFEVTLQQRKVYDSKEFYRKDLLAKGDYDGYEIQEDDDKYALSKRYYDMVAKKVGLGENLNDSATEVGPIIQNIIATSNTAKSISSYLWAALGVCLATQDSWISFFNSFGKREKFVPTGEEGLFAKAASRIKTFGKNTLKITESFIKSFGKSCKSLWNGKGDHKHAGKIFTLITAGTTALLTSNTILRAKKLAKNNNKQTIDKTKESTVI